MATEHGQLATLSVKQAEEIEAKQAIILAQAHEIAELEARIAELEAEPPATPTDPPLPTTKPPAILDDRFPNGVNWSRYFADSGGGPAAPKERFQDQQEGIKVIWICDQPNGTKRSELGIRAVLGGGETPRRDPIGSERWYCVEFQLPLDYKLEDSTKDSKRVLWQCHQAGPGIDNPPLSLELRNGTFRLVRSVETREHLWNPNATPNPGIAATKGVWRRMLIHVLWSAQSGWNGT